PRIKKAMLKIGREDFVSSDYRIDAYVDTPLPIPGGATISAPHMHAISLEALELKTGEKFLEVGAGSGILLAYVKEIVGEKGEVFGIEFEKETFDFAKENLKKAGYLDKVTLIHGDGSLGLPGEAPFDKILISAAAPDFPRPLVEQLKVGGVILAMIGSPGGHQELVRGRKTEDGKIKRENLGSVVFVPLVGKFGWKV
ncbi:protein-L-isoaspartate O-methyltransferase, partial [archaeon]|nr:protein-L-isoaspartate O-methyltransferase [archaeon]